MNTNKVSELMGSKSNLAKALKVSPQHITHWGKEIPGDYIKKSRAALKQRKKRLDGLFDEVMK